MTISLFKKKKLIHLPISAISPTPLTPSLSFFRLQLQVSRRSHEHVWRKPAQHSLQTVPSAPGQPGDHRATRGWTSHLIHRRHQRHADHAALDGEFWHAFSQISGRKTLRAICVGHMFCSGSPSTEQQQLCPSDRD